MLKNNSILLIISLAFLLVGCFDDSYKEKTQERSELAEFSQKNQAPIMIGIASSGSESSFLKGVKLAVKQINAEGGVLNRPFKLVINTDEKIFLDSSLSDGKYQQTVIDIAESFSQNPNIIAVIGHNESKSALLASVVYQNYGILFLAPMATNLQLTNHQFEYFFRTIPNNYEMSIHIADYIAEQGYKKVALLYDRSLYATELAENFSVYAHKKHDTEIIFNRSFFKTTVNLTPLIIDLKKTEGVELIFVASNAKFSQKIYQKTRDMDIKIPFVGGETLAKRSFLSKVFEWENAKDIKKSIIPSIFNPFLAENQEFVELYKENYPDDLYFPEQNAALGYDNIMLLAHAIKRAQSTVPLMIADNLRYMQPCRGTAGLYQFSENGELLSKPFYFKSLHQGKYEFQQINKEKDKKNKTVETCNKIDLDKDSIPNNLDTCPNNTVEELTKGIATTGLRRGCPLDSDKDKIADYQDDCPENTEEEISKGVNEKGCPIDSDKDKTPDYEDACPNNPELDEFIKGENCVEDRDNDEITDDIDKCPDNSKAEISKGVNKKGNQRGCPIDTDLDKLADYLDQCPENTIEEISQGVDDKGCPIDNDQDGVIDYQDECLTTPAKVEIDKNGCAILENSIMLQPSELYFQQGKITLTQKGETYLDALLGQINPKMLKEIKVIVHTDDKDSPETNQDLSEEQAITIADYLFDHGIACEKIISEGKGNSLPIMEETNEQQNSRLEIILMKFRNKPLPTPKNQDKISN